MVAQNAAALRNFDLFSAPLVGIEYMDRGLGYAGPLGLLQALVLELTEQGLDAYVEGRVVGYPRVIMDELGIADGTVSICGLEVEYGDPNFNANHMVIGRDG